MAQIIKLKRSNVPGHKPTSEQLEVGEIALNMADALLYFKEPDGTVKQINSENTIDVINGLTLDNTTPYEPSDDYHPATKAYVDLAVLQNIVGLKTIDKTEIVNNEITLPSVALGDILLNIAYIYEDINSNVVFEVTCELNEEKTKVLFDPSDELNGLFCVLSYITLN